MTTVNIRAKQLTYTLTDEHSASAHGIPVLVTPDGTPLAPWEDAHIAYGDTPNMRGEYGNAYTLARAIAGYAKDDHPEDEAICAMVDRYLSVRDPNLRAARQP